MTFKYFLILIDDYNLKNCYINNMKNIYKMIEDLEFLLFNEEK